MKNSITEQQFLVRQPAFPKKTVSDPFFLKTANNLLDLIEDKKLLPSWAPEAQRRVALGLIGYLQDVLTDAGIWRSFIQENQRLYGKWLPFYEVSASYVPHEINAEDIRFLVWYTLAMNSEGDKRLLDPLDTEVAQAAAEAFRFLDPIYENADTPAPEDYNVANGLDLNNPAEADAIFHYAQWLFMHCYLMTPAFALTLSELMADPALHDPANFDRLRKVLDQAMMEEPTGPLALYLREWIYMIIEGKPAPAPRHEAQNGDGAQAEHPYWQKVTAWTGGTPLAFFKTYAQLNRFFIDVLGWDDTDNLPALKEKSDFAIMVERNKGMLVAAGVARLINLPSNHCYDPAYAAGHALELLTVRGLCPGDLLRYVLAHNALPATTFPGAPDADPASLAIVADNADFIARCYLQKYYRGD